MNNKNTNKQDSVSHLKNAIFNTPPASPTEYTGYMTVHPETEEKAKNISKMMNVPTSPLSDKTNKNT